MSVNAWAAQPSKTEIDEVAVQWAIEGTPMKLNRAEQKAAVKAMTGKREPEDIARLIGSTSRQVFRLRDEL